jgi:hypothetical protein
LVLVVYIFTSTAGRPRVTDQCEDQSINFSIVQA